MIDCADYGKIHFIIENEMRLSRSPGSVNRFYNPLTDQPRRYSRRTNWFASLRLNFIFRLFQSSVVWGKREAMPPSRMASVSGLA